MCSSFYLSENNLHLKPNRELKNSRELRAEIGAKRERVELEVEGMIENGCKLNCCVCLLVELSVVV